MCAQRHAPGPSLGGMSRRTRPPKGPEVPELPLMDAADVDAAVDVKPSWRGWIHAATFPIAIVAGIVLITLAEGSAAKWACAVFMVTSMLLFGNSALYHRFDWKPKTKVVLKRIDHANIFLLIAGTYTPLAIGRQPWYAGLTAMMRHAVQWQRNASTVQTWKISWNPKWPGQGLGRFIA